MWLQLLVCHHPKHSLGIIDMYLYIPCVTFEISIGNKIISNNYNNMKVLLSSFKMIYYSSFNHVQIMIFMLCTLFFMLSTFTQLKHIGTITRCLSWDLYKIEDCLISCFKGQILHKSNIYMTV